MRGVTVVAAEDDDNSGGGQRRGSDQDPDPERMFHTLLNVDEAVGEGSTRRAEIDQCEQLTVFGRTRRRHHDQTFSAPPPQDATHRRVNAAKPRPRLR